MGLMRVNLLLLIREPFVISESLEATRGISLYRASRFTSLKRDVTGKKALSSSTVGMPERIRLFTKKSSLARIFLLGCLPVL